MFEFFLFNFFYFKTKSQKKKRKIMKGPRGLKRTLVSLIISAVPILTKIESL
jgi:hypothetical protein